MTATDKKIIHCYELVNRTLLFKSESNPYVPFKPIRTLVTNAKGIDSVRKANAFLKRYLQGEKYILTEVIEK